MEIVEPGHFLLTMINSAEDISLLLSSYNVCTADEILRSSVKYDERPILVLSTPKRETMCKRKLPANFKAAGLEYNPDKVIFFTQETMKDFVLEALEKLKAGESVEIETEVVQEESFEEVKKEDIIEEPQSEIKTVEVLDSNINAEQEVAATDTTLEPDLEVKKEPETSVLSPGLCRYGVPKLEVSYITPNVLGLEESLFVDVSKEDIGKFFSLVKNRVLNSITNDR